MNNYLSMLLAMSGGNGSGGGVSSWNDLTDRPFYSEEVVTEIASGDWADEDGFVYSGASVGLVAGKTYTVNWNGTEYVVEAQDASASLGEGAAAIGDCSSVGLAGNGEPFCFADSPAQSMGMGIAMDGSTSGTFVLSGSVEVVHKLPEKYLEPSAGKGVEGQTFTIDGTSSAAGVGAEIFNDYERNIAVGEHSHAEGYETVAKGNRAHAEGQQTKAVGNASHAEGFSTTASGNDSHAEGSETNATAAYSHAEGHYTDANGIASHSEGSETTADGSFSHTEGYYTKAGGEAAHAEGRSTTASGKYSHVQGKYNIEDTEEKYAHIVGNGSVGAPSNAHTLDWEGNAWFAGGLELTSPNGTRYRFTVADDGTLSAAEIVE